MPMSAGSPNYPPFLISKEKPAWVRALLWTADETQSGLPCPSSVFLGLWQTVPFSQQILTGPASLEWMLHVRHLATSQCYYTNLRDAGMPHHNSE